MGGANIVQQCLQAGLVDEITIHLVPVILKGGIRLFEHIEKSQTRLVQQNAIPAPGVTHLFYVLKK